LHEDDDNEDDFDGDYDNDDDNDSDDPRFFARHPHVSVFDV